MALPCDYGQFEFNVNGSYSEAFAALDNFYKSYGKRHAYVALAICIPGILLNIVNVIVLTRPYMRTPINAVLAIKAICDAIVMTSYIAYSVHFRIRDSECTAEYFSKAWAYFIIIHGHLSVILHTGALWMSIFIAGTRYVTIRSVRKGGAKRVTATYTTLVAFGIIFAVFLSYIPAYMMFTVNEMDSADYCSFDQESFKVYMTRLSRVAEQSCDLIKIQFWVAGLGAKMVPCVVLAVLMVLLTSLLGDVNKRHRRLVRRDTGDQGCGSADRTTVMLVSIIFVTFATEFPQGLLTVGVSLFGNRFWENVYMKLGDFVDFLSLVNSSINFFLYCGMSRDFRKEFVSVLCCSRPPKGYRHTSVKRSAML